MTRTRLDPWNVADSKSDILFSRSVDAAANFLHLPRTKGRPVDAPKGNVQNAKRRQNVLAHLVSDAVRCKPWKPPENDPPKNTEHARHPHFAELLPRRVLSRSANLSRSAPATTRAAAANPLEKPRPSARPIEQLRPAPKLRAVEQSRKTEGPRSMLVPPATMERPHSTVRPQPSKVSVPTNNATPVIEMQSQPIGDPRSGQGTNGTYGGALPARQEVVPHVQREADQERRRASDGEQCSNVYAPTVAGRQC